jgi:large subunit ribosomal protein L13e
MRNLATVHKKDGKLKDGRGFSLEELREVNLNRKKALKLKVPVDLRRRSSHKENVEALKVHLKQVAEPKRNKA